MKFPRQDHFTDFHATYEERFAHVYGEGTLRGTLMQERCTLNDPRVLRATIAIATFTSPDKQWELELIIDERNVYDSIPRSLLEEVGIAPEEVREFQTSDGRIVTREIGWACVHLGDRATATVVVFAEPGDKVVLGSLTLSGLNLSVDPTGQRLVPGGPRPAAGLRAA